MIKKYTFSLKNNPSTFYTPSYKSTDYSKVLDDLIAADIKEKNSWLNYTAPGTTSNTIKIKLNTKPNTDNLLGEINAMLTAYDNYTDYINSTYNICNLCKMYKPKKLYKLFDGTNFMVLEDGILIGEDMLFFDDLKNAIFLNTLSANMKKTIATIYVDGLKITIKK